MKRTPPSARGRTARVFRLPAVVVIKLPDELDGKDRYRVFKNGVIPASEVQR